METRQHAQREAERPCLWRGFLLPTAVGSYSFVDKSLMGGHGAVSWCELLDELKFRPLMHREFQYSKVWKITIRC